MLKAIALCSFIVAGLTLIGQDDIAWSESDPVEWSDFKNRTGRSTFYKAWTYSGIRFEVETTSQRRIKISVESYFSPSESWVHRDHRSNKLLNHERRHFDITEMYARLMRKEMKRYEVSAREFVDYGYMDIVNDIFNTVYNAMEEKQKQYDADTNHSVNGANQQVWDSWISEQLKSLEEYAL